MKISLPARIIAWLTKHRRGTISQIVAAVGRYVTASQAQRAWDRWERYKVKKRGESTIRRERKPQQSGRRAAVLDCLCGLTERKRCRRIQPGLYAPID